MTSMAEQSSMRRDIISAYLASASKIASWVVVAGIVFRVGGVAEFGLLALIRATIGLLQYVSMGLGPAIVKLSAEADAAAAAPIESTPTVLSYYSENPNDGVGRLYSNAISFAAIGSLVGVILIFFYAVFFDKIHNVPPILRRTAPFTAAFIGFGLLLRLISEAPAALLQTRGKIARDNRFVVEGEWAWIVPMAILVISNPMQAKTLLYAGHA